MPSFPFSRLPPLPELGTSPFSTCESIDGDTKESLAFPEQKIQEQRCKVGKFTEARRIGRVTPRTPKIVSRINRVDVSTATDAGPWNNWGHTTILARATSVGRWGSAGNELGAQSSNGMTVRTPRKRGGREDATGGSGTCETIRQSCCGRPSLSNLESDGPREQPTSVDDSDVDKKYL